MSEPSKYCKYWRKETICEHKSSEQFSEVGCISALHDWFTVHKIWSFKMLLPNDVLLLDSYSFCSFNSNLFITQCINVCFPLQKYELNKSSSLTQDATGLHSMPSNPLCICCSEVGQRIVVCLVLLNLPPATPPPPHMPLGQPLGLLSFLRPTVGDLVLQADTYGMPSLFMLRGGGVLESCTVAPHWEGVCCF